MNTGDLKPRGNGFRSSDIPPLPATRKNRFHIGEDLQAVGDYAQIDPVNWLEEDIGFVQSAKGDSGGVPGDDDFWWNEQRIHFLNGKAQVGLSAVILAVPYIWTMAVVCAGILGPSFWLGSLEEPSKLVSYLVAFFMGVWVFASFFYIIPKTIPWVMSVFGLLLLPFDKLLARLLDRTLESGKSEFNRETGEVTFALGGGKTLTAPFVEFDAYVERLFQHGGTFYRLQFVHRYTGKRFSQTSLTRIEPTREEVLALWDMLQRYMDVDQPLPDIPRLEPYRHKDPVTAEHDRKTGRDPRYWRDLDVEAWKKNEGADLARRQAEFPWDQRRCRLTPQLGKIDMAVYRQKQGREAAVAAG
ncbi:hypothetical protein C8D92_106262 [Tamilnaduibacter salinus]|uniref:Uncharacterized protein n=1 Tax=Tamilnaduibacter salinus TaxID=1484056 RepID=A0A2U1CW69_9GAMM|nr:hypothetical protein [Tamilnaduibacter salinus]PVY75999.1 hypothetical protein C8D92_106262 [Tamilnaduibacter salinus]